MLLHPGFVADGMLPLLGQPALSGFQLIVYHRRGYGHSDRAAGPLTMAQQAEDALGLLDSLGVERAHLVGHSLGGNIAMQVALTRPERVAALVLLEPLLGIALEPQSAQFIQETAQAAIPRFQAGDAAGALEVWLTGAFGPGFRPVLEPVLPGSWQVAVEDAPTPLASSCPRCSSGRSGPTTWPGSACPRCRWHIARIAGGDSRRHTSCSSRAYPAAR